ncbi:MAG: hypothetical protein ACM31L_02385 [Actinomycetota bacterium]
MEEGDWHDGYRVFGGQVAVLYARCQQAYHAFDALPQLADQLRILSVNAELTSARAGDHGRGVRVLTQFATEAVTRLVRTIPEMVALKRHTYNQAAAILRAARDIGKLEAAGRRATKVVSADGRDPLAPIDAAWRRRLSAVGAAAAQLNQAHTTMTATVRSVREVAMQVEMVAANIAIEATTAGPFEGELHGIAEVMHEHAEGLRQMTDDTSRGLREASVTNKAMAEFAALAGKTVTKGDPAA